MERPPSGRPFCFHLLPPYDAARDSWEAAVIGLAKSILLLVGRVLIGGLFVYEATVLIGTGPDAGGRYIEGAGLPGWLWWPALALNAVGGLLIVSGLFTRWIAASFALFCVMTAAFFHNRLSVPNEVLHFGKDLALAGGFLFLIVTGSGALSLDAYFRRRLGLD
jgi:putative oxidoreductase